MKKRLWVCSVVWLFGAVTPALAQALAPQFVGGFVEGVYGRFLGRSAAPDPGSQGWRNLLNGGFARCQVANAIILSQEGQNKVASVLAGRPALTAIQFATAFILGPPFANNVSALLRRFNEGARIAGPQAGMNTVFSDLLCGDEFFFQVVPGTRSQCGPGSPADASPCSFLFPAGSQGQINCLGAAFTQQQRCK